MVFIAAIAVSLMSFGVSLDVAITNSTVPGAVMAAIIAATASVANTLILTRVRRVQDAVGTQVQTIKDHAEDLTESDGQRQGQIDMLRELSRDRSRQIAELNVLADRFAVIGERLSNHTDYLRKRGEEYREGDK